MTTTVPDIERVLLRHLVNDSGLEGELGTTFVTRTPKTTSGAWTRVRLIGGRPVTQVHEHHQTSIVQLDVYAGGLDAVWPQALKIRAAIKDMEGGTFDGVTVTTVNVAGMSQIPDPDIATPARERVILTIEIIAHPA